MRPITKGFQTSKLLLQHVLFAGYLNRNGKTTKVRKTAIISQARTWPKFTV